MKLLLRCCRQLVTWFFLPCLVFLSFTLSAASVDSKKVVFLIGEQEYQTAETLPQFAKEELIGRGIDCQFAIVSDDDPNDFPGLNNLKDADLLVVSVRRRTPPASQMKLIRDYLNRGGAVMGIRTSTHAFDREPPSSNHIRWEHFDNDVFGGDYQGHYGNKPPYDPRSHIRMTAEGREDPILEGLEVSEFRSTAHLYRNRNMAANTTVLLDGHVVGRDAVEPVAWTFETKQGGRSFYTSLGDPEDFELRPFRLLLRNSIYWCLGIPTGDELVQEGDPRILALDLRRREASTGELLAEVEHLPSYRIGVVAIDMWNWHWCKTSTQRVAALVPRMNRVLKQVRKTGVQIFWCPTDVINSYNGTHQREIAVATEGVSLPKVNLVDCPTARDGGGCTCGKERCRGNFGWDGMHPGLEIHRDDLMPNDPEVLYALCRQRGITHLIYMGVHTQACLLGKSVGVSNMLQGGMRCLLARDLTDAHGVYLPDEAFTPDDLTNEVIQHFETYLMPSINLRDAVANAGMWDSDWLVDPVRLAPWGTRSRPHHFDEDELVTLTFPLMKGGEIFYSLDGREPTRESHRYLEPIRLLETTTIRSVVYDRVGKRSLEGVGRFVKRNPVPQGPDIHLSEVRPRIIRGPGHSASKEHFRLEPFREAPKWDQSNRGGALRLDGKEFLRGVGVHAVNQLVYDLEPRYRRFVAQAGIDEEMIEIHHGSNLARHSSVVFRVFVDGRLMAESPIMRVTEKPWRFDVKIPEGSRQISLVATDAGDGSKGDYADWVNAGFVIAK